MVSNCKQKVPLLPTAQPQPQITSRPLMSFLLQKKKRAQTFGKQSRLIGHSISDSLITKQKSLSLCLCQFNPPLIDRHVAALHMTRVTSWPWIINRGEQNRPWSRCTLHNFSKTEILSSSQLSLQTKKIIIFFVRFLWNLSHPLKFYCMHAEGDKLLKYQEIQLIYFC